MHRGRRLRRARALRGNQPYRLESSPSTISTRFASPSPTSLRRSRPASSISHCRAVLYAIQQVSSTNRRIEQMEAAAAASAEPHADNNSRMQEYPDFEKQFGIPPGADLDAETDLVPTEKADEETGLRQSEAESIPTAPPGVRVGSAAYHLFREEAYQVLRLSVKRLQHELRDYNQQKRQQVRNHDEEGDDVSNAFARTARRERLNASSGVVLSP